METLLSSLAWTKTWVSLIMDAVLAATPMEWKCYEDLILQVKRQFGVDGCL